MTIQENFDFLNKLNVAYDMIGSSVGFEVTITSYYKTDSKVFKILRKICTKENAFYNLVDEYGMLLKEGGIDFNTKEIDNFDFDWNNEISSTTRYYPEQEFKINITFKVLHSCF